MRRFARRTAAILALVIALAFVPAALTPAGGGAGPYVSALADLAGGAALAGPQCANKGCLGPTRCGHVAGSFACTVVNGACESGRCR